MEELFEEYFIKTDDGDTINLEDIVEAEENWYQWDCDFQKETWAACFTHKNGRSLRIFFEFPSDIIDSLKFADDDIEHENENEYYYENLPFDDYSYISRVSWMN